MLKKYSHIIFLRGIRRGRDHWLFDLQLPVQSVSAYHHKSCEFEPRPWPGVLDAILSDNICQ
jgi:hypothetical protein